MWAVAGALLAYAPLASAVSFGLTYENVRTYASEVITGPDIEIDYDGTPPQLVVTMNFDTGEVILIDQGDVVELTITLANAKFGENIKNSDLAIAMNGPTVCTGRVKDSDGGTQGSSSVTFEVEAADGDCLAGGANDNAVFTFDLPTLEGLAVPAKAVTASVEVAKGGGSGWPDFRTTGASAASGSRLQAGQLTRPDAAASNSLAPIIAFASGLTFNPTSGGSTNIDLAGGRLTFVRNASAVLGSVTVGVASAARCTTDDPIPIGLPGSGTTFPASCFLQSNGREFSIGRSGEGQGDLMVAVTGDFRAGDTVWLDLDGNRAPSARETLDMQDDGSMMGTFALDDVAGNAGAATGDAGDTDREEGVATRTLRYAPNGDDPLRPATFRSRFMVDFDRADVRDKDWGPESNTDADHETALTVIESTRHAYAIPELGATDEGNVRIKCEVATECTVYLECDDTAGTSRFAQLGDAIAGRSTRTMNAAAIAEELNFGDDGWQGSLSCTVYSTREISVQVLVRSAGTLVNQTYIEDQP